MPNLTTLFVSSLTAIWVSAIALISVQNATPVSLRFLGLRSVRVPIGLLLGFSASAGMVGTTLLLPGTMGEDADTAAEEESR